MKAHGTARERILTAAEKVVAERGAGHMTMDAVVAMAGVSKGGLIYHFPCLRDLLQAMLERYMDQVEQRISAARARLPESPLSEFTARIEVWFALDSVSRRAPSALLAAISREPSLLKIVREKRKETGRSILAASPNPDLLRILLLAVEGLWMAELLQVAAYTDQERLHIRDSLVSLTEKWFPVTAKTAVRKPARLSRKQKGRGA